LRISASWLLSKPGGFQALEQLAGTLEVDAVALPDRGVAERGGDEGLADSDWAHDERVAGVGDEAQQEQLVEDLPVVGDAGLVVEVLQPHGRVQAGGAGAPFGGGGVAAGHLVGEDQLQELGVAEVAGAGQGEPLGEGGHQLAELDPAQQ